MAIVGLVFGDAVVRAASAEKKSAYRGLIHSGEVHRFAGAVEHGTHVSAHTLRDEPPGNGGIAYVDLRYIAGQPGAQVFEICFFASPYRVKGQRAALLGIDGDAGGRASAGRSSSGAVPSALVRHSPAEMYRSSASRSFCEKAIDDI